MEKYLELVQAAARANGRVFFLDSGEGNDWGTVNDEWYVEDLSGWLLPPEDADEFRTLWRQGRKAVWDSGQWQQYHCFVLWSKATNSEPGAPPVTVRFRFVPSAAGS